MLVSYLDQYNALRSVSGRVPFSLTVLEKVVQKEGILTLPIRHCTILVVLAVMTMLDSAILTF